MPTDPKIAAANMQATRIGSRMPPARVAPGQSLGQVRDIPENPTDDAAIITRVKSLLTKAMELLANIGPGTQ
jgi:hypothetical protein